MKNLAVIPARSGSKGLKDKNIKLMNGKPLLAYSIEAALQSGIFDCVHVSTDSVLYAEIGRKYGADIPFLRSDEMASDSAGSWDVVLEVIQKYKGLGQTYDMVTLLQPTSPLRDAADIVSAYKECKAKKAKAIVSVCEMEHSPLWSNVLSDDLSMEGFVKYQANRQRQRLNKYYRINGAIYMVSVPFLEEETNVYRQGCYAYVMDSRKSIDIDTQLDFDIAEYLVIKKQNEREES